MKLTSWSWTEGKYYKPRVDLTRLAELNEGIICTSACLGGLPSQLFMEGDFHYNRNGHALVGEALGRALSALAEKRGPR